jgi:hypothetical protein
MPRRWKCTVCGYIHEGGEPPEFCPVCGADRTLFVPLDEAVPGLLQDLVASFRLHSVAAHFPCGLLPTCAFFVLIVLGLGHSNLEAAAYSLLLVALAITPVSLASGLVAWQKHFQGRRAGIFVKKICLASALLALGLIAAWLRAGDPTLLLTVSWRSGLYLACLAGMVGCTVLLGHFGSKLVFQAHGTEPF